MVRKIFICIAATVVLAIAGLVGVVLYMLYRDTDVNMIGKSPAEMAQITGLPFPPDASAIHYFIHSGGLQDLEMFGKFDCPADRAGQIVADFIADNDKLMGRSAATAVKRRILVAAPFETAGTRSLPIPWWDPDERKIHEAILLHESQAMQFWIMPVTDKVTTIYFYQND